MVDDKKPGADNRQKAAEPTDAHCISRHIVIPTNLSNPKEFSRVLWTSCCYGQQTSRIPFHSGGAHHDDTIPANSCSTATMFRVSCRGC